MRLKKISITTILTFISIFAINSVVFASTGSSDEELGTRLPIWSILPFVCMLLSIAILPLVNGHWWEHNQAKISALWALVFLIPFLIVFGVKEMMSGLVHSIILDYIPFIVLLFGLFVVTGGISLRGTLNGTPNVNITILVIGTVLASWVGTTGAGMLMIRPLLRANKWRKSKTHIFVFFIFLICNIGGSLTPIGDPPLFLGFLRGVPFFWTMKLILPMALNSIILLIAFYILDRRAYKKDMAAYPESMAKAAAEKKEPLKIDGLHNVIFLAMIIGSVILSGILSKNPAFADQSTGLNKGITIMTIHGHGIVIPYINFIRDTIILIAAFLSMKTTSRGIRMNNNFTWAPIKEVAILFAGIFITMIPALAILGARGSELGLTRPAHFFWASGILSSFLDNAPTYLVFMTTSASLGATSGIATTMGTIAPDMLLAVSCGAVFMGANTYIGNAPNFMVRSIAEENEVKMPGFFGYIGWSMTFLIPLFILNTLLFFNPFVQ
ncbi:sodium:proton antiporter [Parasporobacterium paucivorans]|uniref:sodium:proton antiporter n=1 Tax=Parasporobacterium paucivorans TaxID=115544 RepID=UPI001FA88B33|nr:sodium:proton antiporter [Parasporobacterium paucivorans]